MAITPPTLLLGPLALALAEGGRLGASGSATCDGAACAFEPMPVDALGTGVRVIALGDAHACALSFPEADAPSVACWGANDTGQLGLGVDGAPVGIPTGVPLTR